MSVSVFIGRGVVRHITVFKKVSLWMFTCFSLFITFKAKFYLQQVLSEYVFNGYSDVMGKVYP